MSRFAGDVSMPVDWGLERSQICTRLHFPHKGLERSSTNGAKKPVWPLLWLIFPICKVLGVMFPAIVLKVWV